MTGSVLKWAITKSLILIFFNLSTFEKGVALEVYPYLDKAETPHFEEVDRVKLKIMEPCQQEWESKREEPAGERVENLLNCLLSQSHKARKAGDTTGPCSIDCPSDPEPSDLNHLPDWDAKPQEPALTTLPDWDAKPQEPAPIVLPPSQEEEYPYHKDLRVQLHIMDKEYSGEMEFDAVLPLSPPESKDRALFTHPGFILSVKNASADAPAYEHNHLLSAKLGLVYRFTFHKGILGLNVFYDRQWDLDQFFLHHDRLSLGLDYQSGHNVWTINQYLPLSSWKSIDEFYEERAVGGWDLIFKRLFTTKVEGTGKLSIYDYSGKDRTISSIGIDYKINCQSSIGLALDKDFSTDEISGTLQFKHQLGMPAEQKKKDCLQKQYEARGKGLLYRPVQRENRIRLEHRRRSPILSIPDQYTTEKEHFSYTIKRTDYQHVKSNENPEIFVTSKPDWLHYDKTSKEFSGIAPTAKVETVKGTILLPDHKLKRSLTSSFSFKIFVQEDRYNLRVGNFMMLAGEMRVLSLAVPLDEQCDLVIHPMPPGAPVVRYSQAEQELSVVCPPNSVGRYTATGTLECVDEGTLNTRHFAFDIIVQPPSHPPSGGPPSGDSPSEDSPSEDSESGDPFETDNSAPILRAMDQVVRYGNTDYQTPVISNLRLNEVFKVTVSEGGTRGLVVSYDPANNQFVINASQATARENVIIGTIKDENDNFSRWSFKVTVVFPNTDSSNEPVPEPDPIVDNQAPRLLAQDQSMRKGTSLNYSPLIDQLSLNESWTVTVGSLPADAPAVTWDSTNSRFVINAEGSAVAIKEHTVYGTIQDESNNANPWTFKVNVFDILVLNRRQDPVDTTAPTLTAQDQSLRKGTRLNFTPTIGSLRNGEGYTVTVGSLATDAPSVTWDSTNSRFVINAEGNAVAVKEHSISGTIKDESNNLSRWSFKVTVTQAPVVVNPPRDPEVQTPPANPPVDPGDTTAPTLTAQNQSLKKGTRLNFIPTISNLRAGEGYTVTVGSLATDAPSVTWDSTNSRFVINAEGNAVAVKEHSISGTIEDESNNSSSWSFTVTVTADQVQNPQPDPPQPPAPPADTTAPTLTAGNKTVEIGQSTTHTPTIGSLRSGEGYTVTVSNVPTKAPSVTWESTNSRFAINAGSARLGQYTISGTIQDASSNSSTWSFKVTVTDTQAPTLTAQDQSLRKGNRLNYAPTIGNLRSGESYTVTVSSLSADAPSVTWDSTNSRFVIDTEGNTVAVKQHNISGTIQDDSSNSSSWSFKVIVSAFPVQERERDTTAPTLTAQNQSLKKGTRLNYAPTIGNLRSGEGYTVTVSSLATDAPTVTWESTNSRFVINAEGNVVAVKQHTVSGTIQDTNNNSSSWSFTVTVTAEQVQNPQPDPPQPPDPPADTTAPTLTAQNKTVEIGQSVTHTPTIGSLRNGEGYTVTVLAVPNNAPTVTWDSTNSRFAINATSASLGQYNISGTIQDASNNSSTWSFTVTVADTQAPTLTAQDQSLRKGNRLNYAPTIGNLRSGEGYTVTVSSLATDAPSVTWDTNNARFVIDTESNSITVKEHSISGTIQDASNNSSSWSFKVTVTAEQVQNPQPPSPTDTTAPTLTAQNKTVEIGQSVTHTPTIGSLRSGEGYTVTVHTLSNNAPAVTWDSTNNRFAINAGSAGLGRYTISGTIKDENNNSNLWSFIVTVADTQAPTLRMSDLTIEQSESITISPGIGNVRTGESWTVTVGSLTPTALVDEPSVSWNSSSKKFSIRGGDTPGTYTVRGTIQDASSNSSSWSFRIIVRTPAIPTLTAQNQRVKTQKKLRYAPTITGVLSHQSFTVAINSVTPSNDATPRVSWDSENKRFVIRTGGKTGGPYTVRGRITKGVNYSNWSFTITVE